MRSAAAAIAWSLGRRHRWGLAALGACFAFLAGLRLLVLEPGQRVTFDEGWRFALAVVVPLAATFTYLLAVFSFGLAGDLAARRSIYPERMFTLPVTSAALAGWPMLYGTVAVAVVWLATRLLAVWPSETAVPVIWPALFGAVLLAWTQALVWMPYPLVGLRVIVAVLWLTVVGFFCLLALHLEVSESAMLALLAPHLPVAFLVALFAVSRARRGDVLGWPDAFDRASRLRARNRPRAISFPSAAGAQLWLEWRRHGRALAVLVLMVLPFELSLLFFFSDTPAIVYGALASSLLTPPFLASLVAARVRKASAAASDSYELSPFLATRPLTTASLCAAKLAATIASTFLTWLLMLVLLPLALFLSGTSTLVLEGALRVIETLGASRAPAVGLLALAFLVLLTWKQLVQSLYLGLSGRAWLVKASVFSSLSLLTLAFLFLPWAFRNLRELIADLWNALPWILAGLVGFKVAAAAWVATRLQAERLVQDRTLLLGAMVWNVAVVALHLLLLWLVPALLVPAWMLALVAILAVPLVRISAAPLALSRNRHR